MENDVCKTINARKMQWQAQYKGELNGLLDWSALFLHWNKSEQICSRQSRWSWRVIDIQAVWVCPSGLSFRYCPLTRYSTYMVFIYFKQKKCFYFNLTSVDNHCPLAAMETAVSPKGCPDDGWQALLQSEINHSNCEGSSGVLLHLPAPSDKFY